MKTLETSFVVDLDGDNIRPFLAALETKCRQISRMTVDRVDNDPSYLENTKPTLIGYMRYSMLQKMIGEVGSQFGLNVESTRYWTLVKSSKFIFKIKRLRHKRHDSSTLDPAQDRLFVDAEIRGSHDAVIIGLHYNTGKGRSIAQRYAEPDGIFLARLSADLESFAAVVSLEHYLENDPSVADPSPQVHSKETVRKFFDQQIAGKTKDSQKNGRKARRSNE